jgi:hypothetical protein
MEPSARSSSPPHTELPEQDQEPTRAPVGPMRCARDPSVETYLRCGQCEKPICPRCLIQTPVGAKCRECAQLRRLPMFDIKPLDYLKGLGGGLAAGIGGGLAMILIQMTVPFLGIFGLMMAAGIGYGVGEGIAWATRRKQGRWLAIMAALCVPAGMILAWALVFMFRGADPTLAVIGGAAQVFRGSLWSLLSVGFGAAIAYFRVR